MVVAGALEKTLGTRDIRQMGGLWKIMPVTTVATILTLLSIADCPVWGLLARKLFTMRKVQAPDVANLILILVVIANSLMVAVATIIGYALFFGKKRRPNTPHEPSWPLLVGPVFLAVASMVMGIFPNLLASPIFIAGRIGH